MEALARPVRMVQLDRSVRLDPPVRKERLVLSGAPALQVHRDLKVHPESLGRLGRKVLRVHLVLPALQDHKGCRVLPELPGPLGRQDR